MKIHIRRFINMLGPPRDIRIISLIMQSHLLILFHYEALSEIRRSWADVVSNIKPASNGLVMSYIIKCQMRRYFNNIYHLGEAAEA